MNVITPASHSIYYQQIHIKLPSDGHITGSGTIFQPRTARIDNKIAIPGFPTITDSITRFS
ncbi:MAG: hypothetical protein BWY82_02512 [Verrucomicrobia bacterium ADurb.Bin474]|nr:MAG: hypothetical protein BWY82_02512 [Verrucomicrobia bacterium ADurb.Bin474]